MNDIPSTSTTLLGAIASDAQNVRWSEFVARYRPMMEAYMRERFPFADSDETIQETLVAVSKALPSFKYRPEETGRFRNYLTGILRHKALREISNARRREEKMRKFAELSGGAASEDPEDAAWIESLMEIALRNLLADESIQPRTREVFRRVAVNGEKPEDVASSLGMDRNAVDQIKSRMTAKLRSIVRALEKADA